MTSKMGTWGDHTMVFPRLPSPTGVALPNFERLDFVKWMWDNGRKDPIRDQVKVHHEKFGDLMESVMTPDDPYVDWQLSLGYDFHRCYFPKLTYYFPTSFHNYVMFHYDGLALWHFNKEMQVERAKQTKADMELITALQDRLKAGYTKHSIDVDSTLPLPFNPGYDLVVLQEYEKLEDDLWTGAVMLTKAIHWAEKNKKETIIRPHPFVKRNIPTFVLNKIRSGEYKYVKLAEDGYSIYELLNNASHVYGCNGSTLIDAMILQKNVSAYTNGLLAGVSDMSIEEQNQWLTWLFKDRCINTDDPYVKEEVRSRLNKAWTSPTWIKERFKENYYGDFTKIEGYPDNLTGKGKRKAKIQRTDSMIQSSKDFTPPPAEAAPEISYDIKDFVGVFKNAFPKAWCDKMREHFDNVDKLGMTKSRKESELVSKMKKDDTQLYFNEYSQLDCFSEEHAYMKFILDDVVYKTYKGYYEILDTVPDLQMLSVKMQKTEVGGGYHIWHFEQNGNSPVRQIVFIIYLNDVEEGGETELLYQNRRIKPEAGTVVVFPAGFTHAHRGNPPLSNEKYIVTGWFYDVSL